MSKSTTLAISKAKLFWWTQILAQTKEIVIFERQFQNSKHTSIKKPQKSRENPEQILGLFSFGLGSGLSWTLCEWQHLKPTLPSSLASKTGKLLTILVRWNHRLTWRQSTSVQHFSYFIGLFYITDFCQSQTNQQIFWKSWFFMHMGPFNWHFWMKKNLTQIWPSLAKFWPNFEPKKNFLSPQNGICQDALIPKVWTFYLTWFKSYSTWCI